MAKITVCLDAGHYGKYNRSPGVPAYYESDMNWKLHLKLKKYLEGYGFEVITTRSNQATDRGLVSRGAASAGCDLFLSLHSNAVGSGMNEKVDYPVAYVLMDDGKASTEYDQISQILGLKLANVVKETMSCSQVARIATRRMSTDRDGDGKLDADDEYYGVLFGARQVKVPGIILEHSFHTNTKMTNWLLKDSNLEKMAKAEAKAIAEYFGMASGTSGSNTFNPYMVKIDVSEIYDHCLNIRQKPDGNSKKMDTIKEDMSVTIVDEATDSNGNRWGLLKAYSASRNGWIRLDYTKKL